MPGVVEGLGVLGMDDGRDSLVSAIVSSPTISATGDLDVNIQKSRHSCESTFKGLLQKSWMSFPRAVEPGGALRDSLGQRLVLCGRENRK